MEPLTRSSLQDLIAIQEEPCVSLFLPQERSPARAHENIERLRSALASVEAELKLRGLSERGSAQFLATARELETELVTSPGGEGMAIFASPSFFRAYVVPFSVGERLVISGNFHLLPVLPFLQKDLSFGLLALSEKSARFFEGDSQGLREITLEGMPTSMEDAWKGFEHAEEALQFHSVSGGGKKSVMFHGQGGAKDQATIEMTVYLQKVARSLNAFLRESTTPLIFAGVEKLYGLYNKFNEHVHLLPEYLKGNPDHKSADELRDEARSLVTKEAERHLAQAREFYSEAVGLGRTSTGLHLILPAAMQGKVQLLQLAEGAMQWGQMDEKSGSIVLHETQETASQELLGLTLLHVLRHGGHAMTFPLDTMPEGAVIAAVMRY